jgi:hypothetical protein
MMFTRASQLASLLLATCLLAAGCARSGNSLALSPLARTYEPPSVWEEADWSASEEEHRGPAAYFIDRGADFLDIFELGAGIGLILHAEAHVSLLRVGAGAGYAPSAILNPEGVGSRRSGLYGRGVAEASPGVALGGIFYRDLNDKEPFAPDPLPLDERDPFSTGVSVGALFLSIQAALHPLEIFDWLAGWIGFDPSWDDQGSFA